jgi:hypothetical protein
MSQWPFSMVVCGPRSSSTFQLSENSLDLGGQSSTAILCGCRWARAIPVCFSYFFICLKTYTSFRSCRFTHSCVWKTSSSFSSFRFAAQASHFQQVQDEIPDHSVSWCPLLGTSLRCHTKGTRSEPHESGL